MNILKKIYRRIISDIGLEAEIIIKKKLIIEEFKNRNLSNNESLLNETTREQKIIVSLTTFGARINDVYLAIESISKQTLKPDKVILWLTENEFDNNDIPISLRSLEKRGLEIRECESLKSYTKLIPTLREYPNDFIITIDDDAIYPIDLVERLITTHRKFPECICCFRAHKILLNKRGNILPYNQWEWEVNEKNPNYNLLPTGVGGVLYYPNCFSLEVLNSLNFLELAPNADDIWFKVMSLINDVKCKTVFDEGVNLPGTFLKLDSSMINSLNASNVHNNMNDVQLMNVLEKFKIKESILEKLEN